eukprot:142566-Prymnesium_polylepis.1
MRGAGGADIRYKTRDSFTSDPHPTSLAAASRPRAGLDVLHADKGPRRSIPAYPAKRALETFA